MAGAPQSVLGMFNFAMEVPLSLTSISGAIQAPEGEMVAEIVFAPCISREARFRPTQSEQAIIEESSARL
jgi:hypothetical protein